MWSYSKCTYFHQTLVLGNHSEVILTSESRDCVSHSNQQMLSSRILPKSKNPVPDGPVCMFSTASEPSFQISLINPIRPHPRIPHNPAASIFSEHQIRAQSLTTQTLTVICFVDKLVLPCFCSWLTLMIYTVSESQT